MKIYRDIDVISSMEISAVKSLDEVSYYVDNNENSIIESIQKNFNDAGPNYDDDGIVSLITQSIHPEKYQ